VTGERDDESPRSAHYTLTLPCGCGVDVTRHSRDAASWIRVIQRRDRACRIRSHEPGARVFLWELLPPRSTHRILTLE
jgi:hypothetical protein